MKYFLDTEFKEKPNTIDLISICRDCNFAIGLFKDNINNLTNAIKYLEI
jgi:hypothetical protein